MKNYQGLFVFLLLFFSATLCHATLMQTTWIATVSDSDLNSDAARALFTAGETFTATTIYDDASKMTTDYYDGVNGLAEFGNGDDTVQSSSTVNSSTYTDQVSFTLSNNFYTLFAAVDDYYTDLYGYNDVGADNTIFNWAFQQKTGGWSRFVYHADGISFAYNLGYYNGDGLSFSKNPVDNQYDGLATFANITMSTSVYTPAVPIPGSILLFWPGILGLVWFGRKYG